MDWFERLTGFTESTGSAGYEANRQRLEVVDGQLRSRVNGRRAGIGRLELVSLRALRDRVLPAAATGDPCPLKVVQGDARELHASAACAGALFQVASQFNLLEMVGPDVTPECGVTRYADDRTQGPACAMAAGAATIYRNYFAPVGTSAGQRADRQLDGFAALGAEIARGLGQPADDLWTMRNGYALFTAQGIERMSAHVEALDEPRRDLLRERLHIGLHWDVEVTDGAAAPGLQVSQAFCSALPVAYHRFAGAGAANWEPLATLVLEAAYEATLWAAVANARRGASRKVMLTSLGGGAFGNHERWIRSALQRAMERVRAQGLEISLVSYRAPTPDLLQWAQAQLA